MCIRDRCDIKAACDADGSFGSLFERVNPDLKKSICIKLQQNYDAKQIKQQVRIKAKRAIFDEIDEINDIIRDINTDIYQDNMIHSWNASHLWQHHINLWDCLDPMHQTTMLPLLDLTSDVKNDCLTIAQDFGIDTVIDALRLYYQNYKLSDEMCIRDRLALYGNCACSRIFVNQNVFFCILERRAKDSVSRR